MSFPIPILTKTIEKGMDSIIRWRESKDKVELTKAEFEAQRLQWKNEMTKYLVDQVGRPDREFREFITSYEGNAENVHPTVQFMRGAIRPFITLWAIIIITAFMFNGDLAKEVGENIKAIPTELWTIFEYVIGFWFGGRAVQHAVSQFANGKVQEKKKEADAAIEVEKEKTRQLLIETGQAVEENELDDEDFTEQEKRKAFRRKRIFKR